MGLRLRKSINLGGGFRINLSKSGIGYSYGVKGFRHTKKANGGTRNTYSIPGTGLSYVDEHGSRSENRTRGTKAQEPQPSIVATQDIQNASADSMVSEGMEEIISAAKNAIMLDRISNIAMIVFILLCSKSTWFLLAFAIAVAAKVYVRVSGVVSLDYEIDDDQMEDVRKKLDPMMNVLSCKKVWRIVQSNKVGNKKYSSGADKLVDRKPCKASKKLPFPLKSNAECAAFKLGKETLVFLPDKLFVFQGSKIGALSYDDVQTSTSATRFIEAEHVPSDAEIVGQTWKYVNNSGGPDKRFKDNCQLPICLYGRMNFTSASGLNSIVMFSNVKYVLDDK